MSTIHDALKKVEKNMNPSDPAGPQPPQPQRPRNPFNPPFQPVSTQPQKKRPKSSPIMKKILGQTAAFLILFVLIGLLIKLAPPVLKELNIPVPKLTAIRLPSFKQAKQTPAPQARAIPAPAAAARVSYHDSELILQGIMAVGNSYSALINGKIYETGENLRGMTITEISKNTVTLKKEDGTEQILRLPK